MAVAAVAMAALAATGCAKRPGADDKCVEYESGAEKGACYGNGTCNEGFVCLSELCVRPEPADCNAIARQLGQLTLGNYTPKDQRDTFERDIATMCTEVHLSKTDGDCILRATDRTALGACPVPLVFANCERIFAHLRTNLAARDNDIARKLQGGVEQFTVECKKMGITRVEEACILRSMTSEALAACLP